MAQSHNNAVEVRGISKIFGTGPDTVRALDGVSLVIRENEFFTLLGPSGCGKTTLLRLIAGFEQPSAGEILLDSEAIAHLPPYKRPVNTVFQSYALFPHMSVSQNWNGASMRARLQVPTLKYAYPREGFTGWMDNVAVLKDAPNPENAKLFQNFIMDPENAALISAFAKYANGIAGSEQYLDEAFANAPEIKMPEGAPDPDFVPPCDEEVVKMYDKIWTRLQK